MKITIRQLRRLIRETIEESLHQSAQNNPIELADILGFDWYSLTPSEKRDFGDLMISIKSRSNDRNLMLALHNLPIEKHFASSRPGGKYSAPEEDDIDFEDLLQKIKTNYMH